MSNAMADVDLKKFKNVLEIHNRWVCPFDTLEKPEEYHGITLVDTHKAEDAKSPTMMTPRFLDDIQRIDLRMREVHTVSENDDIYLENVDTYVGALVVHLEPVVGSLRIRPRSDLRSAEIPF